MVAVAVDRDKAMEYLSTNRGIIMGGSNFEISYEDLYRLFEAGKFAAEKDVKIMTLAEIDKEESDEAEAFRQTKDALGDVGAKQVKVRSWWDKLRDSLGI